MARTPSTPRPRRGGALLAGGLVGGLVVGLAVGGLGGWTASHAAARSDAQAATPATSTPTSSRPVPTYTPVPTSSLGIPASEAPGSSTAPSSVDLATSWTAPDGMPTQGRLLHETIPATTSHFTARQALVYLPPAALTADPPHLPVDVLLSGQSKGAGPNDVQSGGHIEQTMDALATVDRGLTPIVVVPDQLGPQSANPMCVDGKLGNSRTYLTKDVPAWITSHLKVQTAASAWTIGGFSQGGTCAIQLGAGDPARFGNLIDVSGEDGPTLGSEAKTIADGFDGSRAAYLAAQPEALLRANAPYRDTNAFFAAGQLDHTYGPVMPVQAARARAAGMHVATWVVPGDKHNWTTARAALAAGLAWMQSRIGLAPSGD
ncbi:alpha/beta hydrolase-fold protein [Curtobacterium sp. 1P10AnD]|uniref:alpha/beta hydrolase n=1 Tax=Curtobacterium sp. 1P10AnD TaxID=3132283 RepID=UPI0039A139C1